MAARLLAAAAFLGAASALSVPAAALEAIQRGRIAVVPDWVSADEVRALRRDASALHAAGAFTDNYSTDLADDRTVLRRGPFRDPALGDYAARGKLVQRIETLRSDLAVALERPALLAGSGGDEISYSRYGPGTSLARHIDEHHEELKGPYGWKAADRRSISWLVYLNENWEAADGGALRCYERAAKPARSVGATRDGDLQVAWLRAEGPNDVELPVFLDARVEGKHGKCAFYVYDALGGKRVVSRTFAANPTLYLADGGTDTIVRKTLLTEPEAARRFRRLEPLKSRLPLGPDALHPDEFAAVDVLPRAGTLVLFDSVTLPHEVMPTRERERFASSGWLHEAQQPMARV